jgi:hypothetical protein
VGGGRPIRVDVRVIAATNHNLAEAIRDGKFREDLYDRLRGVEITLMPLGERLQDLQPLVQEFIKRHGLESGGDPYSPYDVFCWVQDHYLRPDDDDREDCETRRTLTEMILRTRVRYYGDSQPRNVSQPGKRKNVRTLEMAVQRAAARGTLRRYGHYAFIDVLKSNGTTTVGPRSYTDDELQRSDWMIALALQGSQKNAGRLMGINDPKKVSKTLQGLGLSKKQRSV